MKFWLTIVNIAAALLIAGVIGLQAVVDRRSLIEDAYTESENLSKALAQETGQLFEGIGLALLTVAEEVGGGVPGTEAERFKASSGLLKALQAASQSTYAFFILDREGRLVATSRTQDPQPVDLSDVQEFVSQRDGAAGKLFVGHARLGRIGLAEGKWVINVTRRFVDVSGNFAGIVAASVSLDYMRAFYDALSVGKEGAVGLIELDGTLLMRSPFMEQQIGRRFDDSRLIQDIVNGGTRGRARGVSPADGVAGLIAFQRIEDLGVVAYVSMAEDEVLALWWQRLAFHSVVGLFAVLVLASASFVVARLVKRQRNVEVSRIARLKLVADEAAHLVAAPDVGTLLARSASISRRLVGAREAAAMTVHGLNGDSCVQIDTDPLQDTGRSATLPPTDTRLLAVYPTFSK